MNLVLTYYSAMPRARANHSDLAECSPANRARSGGADVTRVLLTREDLARTRFSEAPGPLLETVLGLAALRRQHPAAAGSRWLRQARLAFPATAMPLLNLIPRQGYWPEFLDPVAGDLDEGLDLVCSTPRPVLRQQLALSWRGAARPPSWLRALADGDIAALQIVRRALRDFHDTCVAPHWPGIVAAFLEDVTRRIPVLASGGLAELFGTLHKDLAWRDSCLERAGGNLPVADLRLDGHGLLMVPSALWTGPPLFSTWPPELGRNALIYAAQPAWAAYSTNNSRDLAKLLGHTRAATIRSLRTPCTTAQLATRIGISAASASEHATVLRDAGLVQTVRCGRSVRHSLTPLGQSLVNGHEPAAPGSGGRPPGR